MARVEEKGNKNKTKLKKVLPGKKISNIMMAFQACFLYNVKNSSVLECVVYLSQHNLV